MDKSEFSSNYFSSNLINLLVLTRILIGLISMKLEFYYILIDQNLCLFSTRNFS